MSQTLDFIYSLWEDDRIEKLDNYHRMCVWCNITFQGINSTKAMDLVLRIRGMHINICFQKLTNIIYQNTKTYGSMKPLRILLLVITRRI